MSIGITSKQKSLIFPRPESWSMAFENLAVGIVMGRGSMMRVLGDG